MVKTEKSGRLQHVGPDVNIESWNGGRNDDDLRDDDGFMPLPKRKVQVSIACVMLAMFLGALSQTVVATTMPLIIADLGGFDRYTWAATSYMVAATLAFPIVGRLSDIYGRRTFLLLGLAIFSVGSILLGFSESMTQVVVYRAVQGVGGGTVMTCCYVSIADLICPSERGRYHGLLSGVYGVSFVVGPILGGFFADALSWQWAFMVIGLAALPVLLLTARVFPKPVSPPGNRDLDLIGMIALVFAMPPLLVALSSGGVQYEWGSPLVLGMLLFSLVMTGVFVAVEWRAKAPIVPLSLYADPVVGLSVAIMLLASFAMYGSVLFLPLLFQVAFGLSAAQSGGLLIPMLLGMVVGGIVAGQLLSLATGFHRIQALVCTGLMTAGLFLLSAFGVTAGIELSLISMAIAGIGMGGIVATITVGVQNHVPFDVVGVATSALQFYRSVGGVVGLAVLGVVLARQFSSSLREAVPEAVRNALTVGQFEDLQSDPRALVDFATADRLSAELASMDSYGGTLAQGLLDSLGVALWEALDTVFLVAAIAAAASMGFAFFFRVTVCSEHVSGDSIDIKGERRS